MSARFAPHPSRDRVFAGGLSCQAPSEGDQPFASSPLAHPIPQSRRRASGDLFSGSLGGRFRSMIMSSHELLPGSVIPQHMRRKHPMVVAFKLDYILEFAEFAFRREVGSLRV